MQKSINRILLISSNTLRQLLKTVFSFVIAYLVIHYANKEIWGDFVSYLLFVLFAEQVINWGNKEYLLRDFSNSPSTIKNVWTTVLLIRLPLVILLSLCSLIFLKNTFIYILFWLFGRFLAQSTQPLIVYFKKFNTAVIIEMFSFAFFLVLFFYTNKKIDIDNLVKIISLFHLVKGIIYFTVFSAFFKLKKSQFSIKYFSIAFPFFLMAILGFFASRIDLYLVNHFQEKKEIANYQILNGAFVLIQSMSLFIYTPFIKNIYRFDYQKVKKMQFMLTKIGFIIVTVSLFLMYVITPYLFDFKTPIIYLFIAFFIVFPSYYFGILVIKLFKEKKEKLVTKIIAITILVNVLTSFFLLYNNYGILGVLIGSAISQIVMSFLIYNASKQTYSIQS